MKKGRPGRKVNQVTIVRLLEELGPQFQYAVKLRKRMDRYLRSRAEIPADFRPDVYWEPAFGSSKQPRLLEVEKNVSSSSVSKSILSLLTSLAQLRVGGEKNVEGCLVVPEEKKEYALDRARSAIKMIRLLGGQQKALPARSDRIPHSH